MPIRFATLASGSKGNCALVEHAGRLLMIDIGQFVDIYTALTNFALAQVSDLVYQPSGIVGEIE